MDTRYRPTSANVITADRRKMSSSGTIGGPCNAITKAGHFCKQRATVIGQDGNGYCTRHADQA